MKTQERWEIVDYEGNTLEVCTSVRQAQRAQKRWHKLWLWSRGPDTTIQRVEETA